MTPEHQKRVEAFLDVRYAFDGYCGVCCWAERYGADTVTIHAPTKADALYELIDWLETHAEKNFDNLVDSSSTVV